MTCEEARALLLEAEPAELAVTGGGRGPLTDHLRDCPDCRVAARLVLVAARHLAAGLDGSAPGQDLARVARRARVAGAAGQRHPWRRAVRWAPVAAAAALALLLLGRQQQPSAPQSPRAPLPPSASQHFDLHSTGGQTAVVLQTADPNIVVVWFF